MRLASSGRTHGSHAGTSGRAWAVRVLVLCGAMAASAALAGQGHASPLAPYGHQAQDPAPRSAVDPAASIDDVTHNEGNASTTSYTFHVTLDHTCIMCPATVNYSTGGGTATLGTDYQAASGTLSFALGEMEKDVTVLVDGDTTYEQTETFVVSLTNPTNATIADGDGTGTITNDDSQPTISIGDKSANEGDSGTTDFDFTVSLSNASYQTVTAHYATDDGTATEPSDYAMASDTVTFDPGDTSETVTIQGNGDTTYEPDETFFVDLTSPSNATIADGQGQGTIKNDDSQPTMSIGDKSAPEGDSSTTGFDFTVSLSNPSYQTVTAHYATADGTATQPSDYTSASGTVTFVPGDTSETVTVDVSGDTTFEDNETFTVGLSSASNATLADETGEGTIENDDASPTPSIDDVPHPEGNTGTTEFTFTVTLSNPSEDPVTVSYSTSDGTATAPADYASASDTVRFEPGDTEETVTVQVNGDTTYEDDETFFVDVNITTTTTGRAVGDRGTGTIQNDDLQPTISIDDVSVLEGDSGNTPATFTASLSNASQQTITVNFATHDGTAEAPGDYAVNSGQVTFNPGDTSESITVQVNGDDRDEENETYTVELSSPSNATLSADYIGTGTIRDDDPKPTLSINDVSHQEDGGGSTLAGNRPTIGQATTAYQFTVTLTGDTERTVTVNIGTQDGTARAPEDYTANSDTLTFEPRGPNTATFTVQVNKDSVYEHDETFNVVLTDPAFALLADGTGIGTILNDDAAPTLSIQDADPVGEGDTAAIGGTATFTVTLRGNTAVTAKVDFATHDGTKGGAAKAPGDYTTTSDTLTFSPGDSTETIEVHTLGDTVDERTKEFFTVKLSNPVNATFGSPPKDTGVGTITDDDPMPTVSIDDVAHFEGNSGLTPFTFEVTLHGDTARRVTVHFQTKDDTAMAPSDYTAMIGSIVFPPGQFTKEITIQVKGDTRFEQAERFTVTLFNLTNATLGVNHVGIGKIKNDDTSADLSLTKTAGSAPVKTGNDLVYNLTVTNHGPAPATSVQLVDTLPASAVFSDTSERCLVTNRGSDGTGGTVTCALGTINVNDPRHLTITVSVTASGPITNDAQVSGAEADGTLPNEATATTTVNGPTCTIIGTQIADDLTGTSADEVICGLGGADNIDGMGGADTVIGGSGDDSTLDGGGGNDLVQGNVGNDTLVDHSGRDVLVGGMGMDSLDTADGKPGDTIYGGDGVDSCTADTPGDSVNTCESL